LNTIQGLNRMQQDAPPLRLSRRHQRWIYAVGGCLVGSGVAWLIAHYLVGATGSFGETHNPSEPWWLRLHGAAVMAFLVVLGTILPGHVTRAWSLRKNCTQSVRRNIVTGILMLSLVVALALTGYALYYSGSEEFRPYISTGHWVAGLIAAAGFYQHRRGRLQRRNKGRPAIQAERPYASAPSPAGVMLKPNLRRPL
jgi:hypothetical protein